jgi:hypothetical protein
MTDSTAIQSDIFEPAGNSVRKEAISAEQHLSSSPAETVISSLRIQRLRVLADVLYSDFACADFWELPRQFMSVNRSLRITCNIDFKTRLVRNALEMEAAMLEARTISISINRCLNHVNEPEWA